MPGPRLSNRVTVKDRGANAVLANAGLRLRVNVGVIGAKAAEQHRAPDGPRGGKALTIAEIAEKHELGLGVPERSFLRAYVDQNEAQIRKDLRAAYLQILKGRLTPERAAHVLGVKHVAGIQKFIADSKVKPELSPATIARKGSSVPLIDTGQLRSAVTYMIAELVGSRSFVAKAPAAVVG